VHHQTLRETLANEDNGSIEILRSRFFSRTASGALEQERDLWAPREVSFEVPPGKVLGVIGRNGAGKSTLLKILSCITDPRAGRVDLYGRVGCLLEAGAGFHPELSGHENLFLSGAIPGMRCTEILSKLDETVAFAEEKNSLTHRYREGQPHIHCSQWFCFSPLTASSLAGIGLESACRVRHYKSRAGSATVITRQLLTRLDLYLNDGASDIGKCLTPFSFEVHPVDVLRRGHYRHQGTA
jgi:hypothetical protein